MTIEARGTLVAQLGARRHYAVARALDRIGLLDRLVTDLSAEHVLARGLGAAVPAHLRPPALASLMGRRIPSVPRARIAHLPVFALSPRLCRRSGEAQAAYWARRNRAFCRAVARRGFGSAEAVYAFNGAALEIFEAAKARGLRTVLDQTAAPWRWNRALFLDEARCWPGWEDARGAFEDCEALAAREEREWALADRIVCGSAFAADSLAQSGVARSLCAVAECTDEAVAAPDGAPKEPHPQHALHVLFAGTLELRKGVPYLLEAARLLAGEPVHIRLVGPSRLTPAAMAKLTAAVEIAGPVPRAEMAGHYAWADVLVLPTLSEGSANVCREAMAAGLAVVTTPNAGSAVEDGRTGLIVAARDARALADAIGALNADRDLCARLGAAALAFVRARNLDDYARALANACGGGPAR